MISLRTVWAALPAAVGLLELGCSASLDGPAAPLTPPTALCTASRTDASCRPADQVAEWLRRPDLEILGSTAAPLGKQHARVLTVAVSTPGGRVVFRAKWRDNSGAHSLNIPRRELGAYAVQRLFLEPRDWVVPPTAGHCFELESYRHRVDREAEPTFDGIPCVLGFLSYWLEDARTVEAAEDEGWIASENPNDPELVGESPAYRASLANLNLLSHLIDHGDSHADQFVLTRGVGGPRVYLVDNSIAFSTYRNPAIGHDWDWSVLHVRALARSSVERLAALTEPDVLRLRVIEQYVERDGMLVPAAATEPGRDTDGGLRWAGTALQIGLTDIEAQRVWRRVGGVLERVSDRKLGTF